MAARDKGLLGMIAGLVVAAPLMIGGAPPAVQVALSAMAFGIVVFNALALKRERALRHCLFVSAAALAVAASLIQLIPLPAWLVTPLSPHAAELRMEVGRAALMPLTLDVPATVLEVVKGLACLGLLVTVAGFAYSGRRARAILAAIVFAGAVVLLLTVLQRLSGSDRILGFYRPRSMPGSGLWGTFVDGNHAASLWSLSALIAMGLAIDFQGSLRNFLILVGVALAVGVVWTSSRAGAGGLAVGGVIFVGVLLARRLGTVRAVGATLIIGVLAAGLSLTLGEGLRGRLISEGKTSSNLFDNQKVRGWRAGLALAGDYRWTGVGRGAFEAPVAAYRHQDEGVQLAYPEDLLVQVLAEWGLIFGVGLLAFGARDGARLARRVRRLDASAVGAGAGVIAVVVHELADFGLEISGIAIPTVVALGVVIARSAPPGDENKATRLPRWLLGSTAVVWVMALLGGAWAAGHTLRADGEKAVAALTNERSALEPSELASAISRHPADDYLELLAARQAVRLKHPSAMIHLNRALRLRPNNPTAHRLAAQLFVASGHPAQAALEYKLAAEAGSPLGYADLLRILGHESIHAVPAKADELLGLADFLAHSNRPEWADEACLRAVELEPDSEQVMRRRLGIALTGRNKAIISDAATALTANEKVDPSSWVMAADALDGIGNASAADATLARAMKLNPSEGALVVSAARLKLAHGDAVGARSLLATRGPIFTFAERQKAEELLAKVADQMNDPLAAFQARARAKMLAEEGKRQH
jgi:tetratricopeptide (TPR) repeat protein